MSRGFVVMDWAGNILNYRGRFERPEFSVPMEFKSFDAAWDWISENCPEDSHEDLSAVLLKGKRS